MVEREFVPKWRGQVSLRVVVYMRVSWQGIGGTGINKSVERKSKLVAHEAIVSDNNGPVTASNRRAFATYLVKPRPTFPRIDRVTVINRRERRLSKSATISNAKFQGFLNFPVNNLVEIRGGKGGESNTRKRQESIPLSSYLLVKMMALKMFENVG